MNHQLIIGLGNKARHGKDSFASAIDLHYATQYYAAVKHNLGGYKPITVQRIAFSDALYNEVNAFLASPCGKAWLRGEAGLRVDTGIYLPDWVVPTPNAEVNIRAPHGKHAKLLQWWGTEYRRAEDPNYWVKQWGASINSKANIVLTTDMRFTNEAQAIKYAGGYTVQVNRLNTDGTRFIDPSREPNHPSETQLDGYNYDYKITVKTGDLALLEEWAVTLVHYLRALEGHK